MLVGNSQTLCDLHRTAAGCAFLPNVDSIYLLPGEERCVNFRDSDGIPKVHYTYCSLHGRLFNCTCRSKDEAQRLCEDWLVTQDRCYIN